MIIASYYHFIFQSTGFSPHFIKKLLVFEKGLLPKKPLYAEKGDG